MTGAIRLPRTFNDRVGEQRIREHALSGERTARAWAQGYYDTEAVKEAHAHEDYRTRAYLLLRGVVNASPPPENCHVLPKGSILPRRFLWDVGVVGVDGIQRHSFLVGNTVLELAPQVRTHDPRFEVCEAELSLHRDDGYGRLTDEGEKVLVSNASTTPLVVYDRKLFDQGESGFVDAVSRRGLLAAEYETTVELLQAASMRLVQ